MNKAELIAAVAAKTGDTKKGAEATINAVVEVVTGSGVSAKAVDGRYRSRAQDACDQYLIIY